MNAFSSNTPEYWTFHYFIASQSYENYLALFPFPQKVLGHRSSARLTFAAELREWDRRRLSMALPFFAMMYNLLHGRRGSSWRELPLWHGRCWFRSTCPPPCCCCWCTGWRHSAARARGHRGRLWEWEGTRSDAPMGAEGRWEDLLLPGTCSHPRYFYKKQCQQQTAKSEGTRLDASMEGRGCWYQAFISTRHILSPSRLSPPPNIFTKQAPEK